MHKEVRWFFSARFFDNNKAVSYAARFRASDLYFSIPKTKASALAESECKKPRTGFFSDSIIQWPKWSDFWPKKSDHLGHQFQSNREIASLNPKMLSTQANSSRAIDELNDDTPALLSARRAAGGRHVSPWPDSRRVTRARARDQGKRTRRAPLRGYVLADYRSSSNHSDSSRSSQSANMLGSDASWCQNTKYQSRLTRAPSARLSAARPKTANVCSDPWVLRPLQRTRRVSPRRQTTPTACLGVFSNLYTLNRSVFFASVDCFGLRTHI